MGDPNVFSFLITTDNHMGFKKDDHLRRKDSFMAFDEALTIARNRDVDFILLGGDLFHENRPSADIEHKCIKIIRKHMSDPAGRGTSFKRVRGQFSHFHRVNHANFEDPNLTVTYPILTIHGNHDDPTGPNAQSICEKLATTGLLNYFGAIKSLNQKDKIIFEPIVLQKGETKLALYGIGFIPDFKLNTLFEKKKIHFEPPPKDTFNILVVHQNRVPFTAGKFIPDSYFPSFFNLIIRGHEHDTQSPEHLPQSKVNGLVYQPGSTVATSISTMEARPKKVGIFTVKTNDLSGEPSDRFKVNYELVELRCCRRMLMKDISHKDIFQFIKESTSDRKMTAAEFKKYSCQYVKNCINKMLLTHESNLKTEKASISSQLSSVSSKSSFSVLHPDKLARFDLPLIKIRLEYAAKNEKFDPLEVISDFYPLRVANKDLVFYKKQKLTQLADGSTENVTFENEMDDDDDDLDDIEFINLSEGKRDTIEYAISEYFQDKPAEERLKVLSLEEYTNAIKGAFEDGNVIAKVLGKKKREILHEKYKHLLRDEQLAESEFHDIEKVKSWFLKAFESSGQGGDEIEMDM